MSDKTSITTRRICSVFNSRPENEASASIPINHSILMDSTRSFYPIDNYQDNNDTLNASYNFNESNPNELPIEVPLNEFQMQKFERDLFINGAVVAAKYQSFVIRRIIDVVKQMADRSVSEFHIRKVWCYWAKFKKVHYSTAQQITFDMAHETNLEYQRNKHLSNTQYSDDSFFQPIVEEKEESEPPVSQPSQFNNMTLIQQQQESQAQIVEEQQKRAKYPKIREAILADEISEDPKWTDLTVKIMVSVAQFVIKKNIETQVFGKLKEVIRYNSIKWKNSIMGETVGTMGKYIYFHCKFDKNIIRKKKYLKAFLLQTLPSYFYSHNSLNDQKLLVASIEDFYKMSQMQDVHGHPYRKPNKGKIYDN